MAMGASIDPFASTRASKMNAAPVPCLVFEKTGTSGNPGALIRPWDRHCLLGLDQFNRNQNLFDQILRADWCICMPGQPGLKIWFWFCQINHGLSKYFCFYFFYVLRSCMTHNHWLVEKEETSHADGRVFAGYRHRLQREWFCLQLIG